MKIMKKILLMLFLSTLMLLSSRCHLELSRDIWFRNNSGKPVYIYLPCIHDIIFPDTTLPIQNPHTWKFDDRFAYNFGSYGFDENDFFREFVQSDTLSVFFFDPDTLSAYNWEIIRNEYKILIRYDLSHEDLKRTNWIIYYPPNEIMKNMKMYPTYE
jgi:hypothetical protein